MKNRDLLDFIGCEAERDRRWAAFPAEWLTEAEPYLQATRKCIETTLALPMPGQLEPAFAFTFDPAPTTMRSQRDVPESALWTGAPGLAPPPAASSDPAMWSIQEIASALRRGMLSVTELVEACLQQMAATEPDVQAWELVLAEEALAEARHLDDELRRGKDRGPLHGIPVGVKDNIFTRGTRTTGGSELFRDFVPSYDAAVVTLLRQAGAIVMGKTTTTEMALGDPPPTRNPWNLGHTPGGSSSGSAAAVAAGHVPFSLGTQTGGSLNRPAGFCGLLALKPTYGRISRHGVFPVSWTMDHVGAMTRTAVDLAIVMGVLLGTETGFPSQAPPAKVAGSPKGAKLAHPEDAQHRVRGLRIGRPDRYFFDNVHPSQQAAYDAMLRVLEHELGAVIKDVVLPPSFEAAAAAHTLVMNCEVAAVYGEQLREQGHLLRPVLRSRIMCGLLTGSRAYIRAQQIRSIYVQQLWDLYDHVDILATPTTTAPAPEGIHRTGSSVFNAPFSLSGFPTLVLPTGFAPGTGLPLSAQFIARPFDEQRLLALAIAYQQVTDWHKHWPRIVRNSG